MLNHCTPCIIDALVPVRIPVLYPSPEILTPMDQALKIKANVLNYYHLTEEELTGKSRLDEIVKPRHVGMYLTDQLLKGQVSLKVIGWLYGGRDHTTVIYAIDSITCSLQSGRVTPDELQAVIDGRTGPGRVMPVTFSKASRTFDPQDITEMVRLRRSGMTLRQIARKYGIPISSVSKFTNAVNVRKIARPKACYSAGQATLIESLLQSA